MRCTILFTMCIMPTQDTVNTTDFYLISISCDHLEQILKQILKQTNERHTFRPVGNRLSNSISLGYLRTIVKPSWGVRFFCLCLLLGPPLFVCSFICRVSLGFRTVNPW